MKKLGIERALARGRFEQYKARVDAFDFDMTALNLSGTDTPGAGLRTLFSSSVGRYGRRSRNLAGVKDPARRRDGREGRQRDDARGADHGLPLPRPAVAGGRYWMPAWYNDTVWLAHWDAFSRPERQPKLGVGAPDTWWWDEDKAKKIGL